MIYNVHHENIGVNSSFTGLCGEENLQAGKVLPHDSQYHGLCQLESV